MFIPPFRACLELLTIDITRRDVPYRTVRKLRKVALSVWFVDYSNREVNPTT